LSFVANPVTSTHVSRFTYQFHGAQLTLFSVNLVVIFSERSIKFISLVRPI